MEFIMFIAGWVALFHGQVILALACWTISHLLGKERSK
jgi:hypothetical protein